MCDFFVPDGAAIYPDYVKSEIKDEMPDESSFVTKADDSSLLEAHEFNISVAKSLSGTNPHFSGTNPPQDFSHDVETLMQQSLLDGKKTDTLHTCQACGMTFQELSFMKTHYTMAHTEKGLKSYECSVCHKFYTTRALLRCHVGVHFEKQFKCACGVAYHRRDHLTRHHNTSVSCRLKDKKQCSMTETP